MAGSNWTDHENDLIVADYFAMLAEDLAGHRPNKAAHNLALQARIPRSRSSIEFKHQNISAVLQGLGETWLTGYRPAFNYQASLEDAVMRWLDSPSAAPSPGVQPHQANAFHEARPIWIGPPPHHSNQPPPNELEQVARIARKFDVAGRDARNRQLGRAGEAQVLAHEQNQLALAGRPDLAKDVRWISDLEGDGAGYDIASFTPEGAPRLIEVKTTNGWERTPFHLSPNEIAVSRERAEDWVLFRLWNFARAPRAFELRPPLEAHVALTPTAYRASLL